MGLAFQIQDDILGIWGDPAVTGKAAGNDLLRRKKSLPAVHALSHPEIGPQMQAAYAMPISSEQLPELLALLERAGTRRFAETVMADQHQLAMTALTAALGDRAATSPLTALAESLLYRSA